MDKEFEGSPSYTEFLTWFNNKWGPEPTRERTNIFPLETYAYRLRKQSAWEAWMHKTMVELENNQKIKGKL